MGMPEITRTAVKAFIRNRVIPQFVPSDSFCLGTQTLFSVATEV